MIEYRCPANIGGFGYLAEGHIVQSLFFKESLCGMHYPEPALFLFRKLIHCFFLYLPS